MSALGSADLQNNAGENLASQCEQPARQSAFPPFSGNLRVDEKLKLSHENFKQTVDDFFTDKNVTPLSQITATPAFPTPHVLAQFASKAYEVYRPWENDAHYETRLTLPDGWKLLTTASNNSKFNGYFGAAYWHPEHQQVVIAHRSIKLRNVGSLWTELFSVVFKHHASQMNSASTFANKVVEVLREVNRTKGVSFQIFFTGHALGGLLAQVTTFTTENLKTEGNIFLKTNDDDCYHPHTIVFDSPGCRSMLLQMADKYDVRLDGRSIDIEHLDITSYLSAPNLINTCNLHVGTVYRIFPDLSGMGWLGKHTALYNLVTLSMQKIVETFDPETGQVRKDEQGRLKVQVVIDWPISSSMKRGKEYKKFFEWARHLINYQPRITDESFWNSQIRYQTKTYDERLKSLSVFSKKEQEFLQCYLALRQWPEFFKPKELFSAMEDNQAQEEAEYILQRFMIKNDTIICTDPFALQALVPYVKRLLQLFPEIKEIRNKVYQCETRTCIEQINQSPLDFNPDDLSVREFLEVEQQKVLQLQMVDGDEWTGITKVYQVLQKNNCLTEGQYTVLTLERLLSLNKLSHFRSLMQSLKAPHLILVACEANQLLNAETKEMIRTFFESMKQKSCIKIILTTRGVDRKAHFLQRIGKEIFENGYVTRVEQLAWCDLTSISQEKILEETVKFQGAKISLNELMSAESPVANFLPIGDLLEEKELTIADPVPISNSYNESSYIGRKFRLQKAIKQDIFSDKSVEEKNVFLASTEQEFTQLCQLYPNRNVHWLQKDKSGKLHWHQSQGSLETVRRYIDTDSSHTYTADDLDKLLEQAQHQRVMLISDTAGMGKSTVLTHLSKQIKQKFPTKWVVRIDLNDHTDALKPLKEEQIDKDRAIEFVSEKLLKLEPGLELELFKQCCEEEQKVGIVIILDGVDEVSQSYKDTLIDLLQALRQTAVEQLWVTTRPHLRDELEDKLQQLSYTLETFSEENQAEFLKKFWGLKGWYTEVDNEGEEQVETKLQTFAKELLKTQKLVSNKEVEITGIPLQTRILAEAFVEEIRQCFQSGESIPSLNINIDMFGLFKRFIDRQYDVYLGEKVKNTTNKEAAKNQKEILIEFLREDHQVLALEMLLTEEELTLFQVNNQCTFSAEELTRIGIVQISYEGKLQFIHSTFADYYVADFLVDQLANGTHHFQVQDFLLKKIFTDEKYPAIRVFVDGLLSKSKPAKDILKQYGNRIDELCQGGLKLHQAADEGNAHIIGFYLDSLQEAEHTDTINNLLIAEDKESHTAWHLAAKRCNTNVLEILWNWSTNKLTKEELKGKLLLAVDCEGKTAWHLATEEGNTEVLQKIWKWAKETLTPEELRNKFLFAQNLEKETAWHMAAKRGNIEVLEYIWELAKEEVKSEDLNNEMLLSEGLRRLDAWLQEAEVRHIELLQKLEAVRDWAKRELIIQKLNVKLLLAKDEMKETAWHVAAKYGNMEVLQKLWNWAEEELTPEELSNEFLLATDIRGQTAWLYAAEMGNRELLEKLWKWAEGEEMSKGLTNTLLLTTDNRQQTAFHVAAEHCQTEVLQKLWNWAKEKLTPEEINNKLLLAEPLLGKTAWHYAAELGNTEVLEKLWKWAKGRLTREDLINKFLLAKDDYEQNILHVAAKLGDTDVLEKLWEWAKEQLISEDLKYKLLLAKDKCERTAWQLAAVLGNKEVMEKLWKWAKERLTTEDLNNKFLLAKDDYEQNILHVAANRGDTDVLEKLWEWAEEQLTPEDLKYKLLLAKDKCERTAWQMAAVLGNTEVLEKLWDWAEQRMEEEELKTSLLLAKDDKNETALQLAKEGCNTEVFQKLWEWAGTLLSTEELKQFALNEDDMNWTVRDEGENTADGDCQCDSATDEELNIDESPILAARV